jgi:hypothetical protein
LALGSGVFLTTLLGTTPLTDRKWLGASISAAACIAYAVVGWKRLHGETDLHKTTTQEFRRRLIIRVPQLATLAVECLPAGPHGTHFPPRIERPHLRFARSSRKTAGGQVFATGSVTGHRSSHGIPVR